eukprot:g894.t1
MKKVKVHPKRKGTLVSVQSKAYQLRMSRNMKRRESTATDLLHEMYLMNGKRFVQLYADGTPVEPQQILKARGDIIRWADLPENAVIVFVSHEWAGWDHPDPDGVQTKTLARLTQQRSVDWNARSVHRNIVQQGQRRLPYFLTKHSR